MSLLVKICECCGCDYRRPTGSSKINDLTWANRQFCSSVCGLRKAGSAINYENPGAPAVFDRSELSAKLASQTLLDMQMAYYGKVARERGLNDVWEAAVQLGMAA
jgi:hypothetical protein